MAIEIVSRRQFPAFGYEVRREVHTGPDAMGTEGLVLYTAYSLLVSAGYPKPGSKLRGADIVSEPGRIYLGDWQMGAFLTRKMGIRFFAKRTPESTIASVGFNPIERKWYGWSHRAINGYGVGDRVVIGSNAFRPADEAGFVEQLRRWHGDGILHRYQDTTVEMGEHEGVRGAWVHFDPTPDADKRVREGSVATLSGIFEPCPEWGRGEWTAQTLEDAYEMACDFAEGVS